MTIQKGVDVLVGLVDATYAGAYTIVSGQTTGDIRISDEYVDVTHKSSTGLWREGADGAGIRNASFTVGGYLNEDSSLDSVAAAIFGTGNRHASLGFLIPGVGMVAGDFAVNLETSGALNTAAEFTLTAENAGDVTFVPGVQDRYAMQASLVLNFVEDSYWVAGVHNTAFASVTGASVTRASKKWDPDWSFVSGDAVGALEEFASGVAAVGARGLLVEATSTNGVHNPRCEGAVVGTPGTLPTGWAIDAPGESIRSVVASGTIDGWDYVDIKFDGTPTGGFQIYFVVNNAIAASTGQTWTTSCGLQIVDGDTTNIDSISFLNAEYTSGPAYITQGQSSALSVDGSHRRFTFTRTLDGGGTTAYTRSTIYFAWTSGAIDITLRIFAPQVENKAYPTSPVLPESGTVDASSTRQTDVISVSNGSWASETAATLFVDAVWNYEPPSGDFSRVAAFGDAITNQLAVLAYTTTGSAVSIIDGGADNAIVTETSAATGVNLKYALAYAVNDAACSITGATQATDSSVDLALSSPWLAIGSATTGGSVPIGSAYIKDIQCSPRRLTNVLLEALVGN